MGNGAVRAVVVGALAAVAGYAVLIASSSAALILPIVDSLALGGTSVLQMTAQIAIADTACIVAVPLVIDPGNAVRAGFGAFAVIAAAVVLYFGLQQFCLAR